MLYITAEESSQAQCMGRLPTDDDTLPPFTIGQS
jgi:hypothetical protein